MQQPLSHRRAHGYSPVWAALQIDDTRRCLMGRFQLVTLKTGMFSEPAGGSTTSCLYQRLVIPRRHPSPVQRGATVRWKTGSTRRGARGRSSPGTTAARERVRRWCAGSNRLKSAGIPKETGLHLHDLRHTGSTWSAQSGATLKELLARIGHSSTRAAMIYQRASRDRDDAIATALNLLIMEARSRASE